MNFRLPAKYALLIINIIVLAYFFLYFCLLGFEYHDSYNNVTIIFKGLDFNPNSFIAPQIALNTTITVAFGHIHLLVESLWSSNVGIFSSYTSIFDTFVVIMLSVQCFLIFLSFINLFIWRGFKKAKTIDITSKILILLFVSLSISWIIMMNDLTIGYSLNNKPGYAIANSNQAAIYWIGQSLMPLLFMFIHIWMTAPLYRKRNK
ncbi:hypothetical protein [Spiroplasma sp. BIUS-1]|uniref:hypothetical protein n=1 Tax=Spiroplasma sp. BIUS-1 TaxID=216964 RepID=UPI0013982241|nr:hypothetical protein [Spiroplasma sp. BIUS-1]QHX36792.1 hypothetical protein SBIUS_v1c05390 [Spiroplasma sp. BIUS-1]